GRLPPLLRPLRLRVLRGAARHARQPLDDVVRRAPRLRGGAQGAPRPLRQPVADVVPVRADAPSGAHRRRRLRQLSLPHPVSSAAAQAAPAEVPRGPGGRRRQLPQRHQARGEGGRAPRAARRPLPSCVTRRRCSTRSSRCTPRCAMTSWRRPSGAAPNRWRPWTATAPGTRSTRSTRSPSRSSNASPRRSRDRTFLMVAEGLPGGRRLYPAGADEAAADCWIVVDPIDGTRGLMYQKRSAWILTAAAPNRGAGTSLRDVELAVQTEIPLVKQHLSDQLWALRGSGAQ